MRPPTAREPLPHSPAQLATGYGHRADDVAAVRVSSGELLVGYHDEVHQQTVGYLVSVIADDLQHAGQAAFVRGVVERR